MSQEKTVQNEEEISKALESARSEVNYVVTDFSVELIVQKYKDDDPTEGDIYIPAYQRILVWSDEQQSYFIESLLMRVPVPPIFFYDVRGKLEIVDGSQRIRCLVAFASNKFRLTGLKKVTILNGLKFSEFPIVFQRRFNNTPIRSFVLEQGTSEQTRIELFRRLNTSGKKLTDAEIRKGAYQGKFLDLVIACANDESFIKLSPVIAGKRDPVAERQELVTRFFIYVEEYENFTHDVQRFLDDEVVKYNKTKKHSDIREMRNLFNKTMSFISENYETAFYRPGSPGRLPRVRFEAVAVGTALALKTRPALKFTNSKWLLSKKFEDLVKAEGTNSGPKLRSRIEYVRDNLLNAK